MSAIQTQHRYRVDLDSCPLEAALPRPLMHTDALADEFIIAVRRSMTPVRLDGMTVLGNLTFSTRQTLPLTGSAADATISLPLPAEAYAIPGPFTLTIQVQSDDVRHTLLHLTGEIARSSSDALISSGELLPTLPELLQQVSDMQSATKEAQTAAAEADAAALRMESTVSDALHDMTRSCTAAAPAIVATAAGAAPAFSDAAERPAQSICSALNVRQEGEGTPSPDNIRPLVGWDSVQLYHRSRNLFDADNYEDVGVYVNGSSLSAMAGRSVAVPIVGGKTYTVSKATATVMRLATCSTKPAGGVAVRASVAHTSASAEPLTITANAADTWLVVQLLTNADVSGEYGTIEANVPTLMIEEGATASPWEPYVHTLTAELPETVYGGTLDWTSGVLTVTHESYLLDGVNNKFGQIGESNGATYGHHVLKHASTTGTKNLITSHLQNGANVGAVYGYAYIAGADRTHLFTFVKDFGNVEEANAWLVEQAASGTPYQICYKLQTPYTIQLNPHTLTLLKGSNTLWSSSGDTTVEYIVDTKTYIDNAIAASAASVLNT